MFVYGTAHMLRGINYFEVDCLTLSTFALPLSTRTQSVHVVLLQQQVLLDQVVVDQTLPSRKSITQPARFSPEKVRKRSTVCSKSNHSQFGNVW